MKPSSIFGIVVSAAILCSSAASAAIIQNGGFETGTFANWTVNTGGDPSFPQVVIQYGQSSGYPTGAFGEPIPAPVGGGLYGAYFVSDVYNQSISQSFSLTAGEKYTISYDIYSPQNGQLNPFDALLQSATDGNLSPIFTAKTLGNGWVSYSADFFANAGPYSFTLGFHPLGVPAADFVIDNVNLTVAVPEPATWAMMILGFMGIGFLAYRRRSSTASSFRLA
ncbi:PEPxxWA-CTERM sorting domain-containing protein [Bradyrhizobium sp. CB3481]|uniref:PEPxxWA-CTERM sorting domain-containing protein n=1 Tax=Bradyrhizobium sp. CB3481 TaxID=3039158 RepID=UPI0024B12F53|nr:PEPxxWA-CTERM sorting domain-containing protein [Bradyrhizobium sp. CB3481]WFU18777.1 PEPxxWA-CTERM sorting domain-containing protein [Bradyrhizobium sp. CB3481]